MNLQIQSLTTVMRPESSTFNLSRHQVEIRNLDQFLAVGTDVVLREVAGENENDVQLGGCQQWDEQKQDDARMTARYARGNAGLTNFSSASFLYQGESGLGIFTESRVISPDF